MRIGLNRFNLVHRSEPCIVSVRSPWPLAGSAGQSGKSEEGYLSTERERMPLTVKVLFTITAVLWAVLVGGLWVLA
jgi:hypothetical protein